MSGLAVGTAATSRVAEAMAPMAPLADLTQTLPRYSWALMPDRGIRPAETRPATWCAQAKPLVLQPALTAADQTVVKVGNGSGVIVGRDEGHVYILTNAHVVGSFNDRESVVLPDGRVAEGTVIKTNRWYDFTSRGDDLAVVRVRTSGAYRVAHLMTGPLQVGSPVLQAGFPQTADSAAVLVSRRGSGLYAKVATVSEDLDPRDRNSGRRLQGSYEIGLTAGLPVGSSGGGTFDAQGRLAGLNGRFANGLPMQTQDDALVRPAKSTTNYVIDTQTLRAFMRDVVPGF